MMAPIEPVAAGTSRPLWSVMIPTFNCADFLRQTLESVLAQDPGPETMQIEVVDNCSATDEIEAVTRSVAGERVTFSCNSTNLGFVGNLNRCIERSSGHLVHILHSDDFVLDGFYEQIGELSIKNPNCSLLATRVFFVDEMGIITWVSPRVDWMESPTREIGAMLQDQYLQCAGVVVRRAFYEQFGGFRPDLVYCVDWEMWVRAVHLGTGVVDPRPLATRRISAVNETARLARSAANIKDYLQLARYFKNYDGFSESALHRLAADRAYAQYSRFRSDNDIEAARANLEIYTRLVPYHRRIARKVVTTARKFIEVVL